MAKINKGIEGINISKQNSPVSTIKSSTVTSKPEPLRASTESQTAVKTKVEPLLTHKQIEERAKLIWQQKGCPMGQDEKNWLEAEAQLKKELLSK